MKNKKSKCCGAEVKKCIASDTDIDCTKCLKCCELADSPHPTSNESWREEWKEKSLSGATHCDLCEEKVLSFISQILKEQEEKIRKEYEN